MQHWDYGAGSGRQCVALIFYHEADELLAGQDSFPDEELTIPVQGSEHTHHLKTSFPDPMDVRPPVELCI